MSLCEHTLLIIWRSVFKVLKTIIVNSTSAFHISVVRLIIYATMATLNNFTTYIIIFFNIVESVSFLLIDKFWINKNCDIVSCYDIVSTNLVSSNTDILWLLTWFIRPVHFLLSLQISSEAFVLFQKLTHLILDAP